MDTGIQHTLGFSQWPDYHVNNLLFLSSDVFFFFYNYVPPYLCTNRQIWNVGKLMGALNDDQPVRKKYFEVLSKTALFKISPEPLHLRVSMTLLGTQNRIPQPATTPILGQILLCGRAVPLIVRCFEASMTCICQTPVAYPPLYDSQ